MNNNGNEQTAGGITLVKSLVQQFTSFPETILTRGATRSGVQIPSVNDATLRIGARIYAIANAVVLTAGMQQEMIENVVQLFSKWIARKELVRVIGAGRALLAGAIPANRLAHAGVNIHHLHDLTPMPNSKWGGAILACSASGKTPDILGIMAKARKLNQEIKIVGFADAGAREFRELCDYFVGIYIDQRVLNPLTALADTGEYVISSLLDAMVVLAAERAGFKDQDWRTGHEDLGPTGPYSSNDK